MKSILRKISTSWILLVSFFITTNAKADSNKDIAARINKVRKALQQKKEKNDVIEIPGARFNKDDHAGDWINWGNWGNWNNWRNWNNWNNWANWGNWPNL